MCLGLGMQPIGSSPVSRPTHLPTTADSICPVAMTLNELGVSIVPL